MKNIIYSLIISLLFVGAPSITHAQSDLDRFPQLRETLTPFRMPLPEKSSIKYIYLDEDSDPDGLKATLVDGRKVLWIDDDDDMKLGDSEGDLDNDCVLIDLNNDGAYGSELDMIIDYIDENDDGKADYQVIIDNNAKDYTGKWKSHYIWFVDNDQDGVFGYVNWDSFKFEGWDHGGRAKFFADYHGQSTMLKVHMTTWNLEDTRYNWENPFLFYDYDNDGLSEMAVRVVDEPIQLKETNAKIAWKFSQQVSLVAMTFDLDNDSRPGNELDFDMSLKFAGEGYDYSDQRNPIQQNKTAPGSDVFFADSRWRHHKELIYPNHNSAYDLTFERGNWDYCWLVFDEDDDCHRWERVEFYEPKSPFKMGSREGGLDDNPQADVSGDRGEWDADFSGKGNLYVSPLDGKLHLYGAELGYWRIDQHALFYQGWQGWQGSSNISPEDTDYSVPDVFATVKYEDTDANGFFDRISYDMDGDTLYEEVVSLQDMGISDEAKIIVTADLDYEDFVQLYQQVAENQYAFAGKMNDLAEAEGLATEWYAFLKSDKSTREKYHNGYWLARYLHRDLMSQKASDEKRMKEIQKVYYGRKFN